jgi:hypothetical protein
LRGPCLALAEEASTVVVTADDKLFVALGDTPYANLTHPLTGAANLTRARMADHACTATRTATELIRTATQWTK